MADFVHLDYNEKQFRAFLASVMTLVDDWRVPLAQIADDFYTSERSIFNLKGPGGYEDLAPSTKASKSRAEKRRRAGVSGIYPILVATGLMRNAILEPYNKGSYFRLGKRHVAFGVDRNVIPYADLHQRGTRKMPRRSFIFIEGQGRSFPKAKEAQGRIERWTRILVDHLSDEFARRGWDK